jgi:hypothetical protein
VEKSSKNAIKTGPAGAGVVDGIDEAFEAAMGALRKTAVAPENTSYRSTVSGPVAAAKRCGANLKKCLL